MTNKEAAKVLITNMFIGIDGNLTVTKDCVDEFLDAICVALSALLKQEENSKCKRDVKKDFWHVAKADPPEKDGKYFALQEDSHFPMIYSYKNGRWFYDTFLGEVDVEIIYWADSKP